MNNTELVLTDLLKEIGSDSTLEDIKAGYDSNWFNIDGNEYLVIHESEINEYVLEHIKNTICYFNSDFLSDLTGLPDKLFKALDDESYNETIIELIEKFSSLDELVEDAIRYDSAGHFLSSYDGNEIELINGYYAFKN